MGTYNFNDRIENQQIYETGKDDSGDDKSPVSARINPELKRKIRDIISSEGGTESDVIRLGLQVRAEYSKDEMLKLLFHQDAVKKFLAEQDGAFLSMIQYF